jgi:hypothetical protein
MNEREQGWSGVIRPHGGYRSLKPYQSAMKLVAIKSHRFVVLLLLPLISCATVHKASPEGMGRLKYGMELLAVNKVLDNKGGLIFRGVLDGKHYVGVYYNVEQAYRDYCLVFEDDLLVGIIPYDAFQNAWTEQASLLPDSSGGFVLPYEKGFDELHDALAANILDLARVDFSEVDPVARQRESQRRVASINEALAWSWAIIPLSPILIPFLVSDSNRSAHFDEMWSHLSLRLPRQSVVTLLG